MYFEFVFLQKYKEFERAVRVEEIDGLRLVKRLAEDMEEMFHKKAQAMKVSTSSPPPPTLNTHTHTRNQKLQNISPFHLRAAAVSLCRCEVKHVSRLPGRCARETCDGAGGLAEVRASGRALIHPSVSVSFYRSARVRHRHRLREQQRSAKVK